MLVTIELENREALLCCDLNDCKLTNECHLIYKEENLGIPVRVVGMTDEEFLEKIPKN